jgi:hypothetical protein
MSASKPAAKPLEVEVGDDKVVRFRLRVPASLDQRLRRYWHKQSIEDPARSPTLAALIRQFIEDGLERRGG